MIGIHLQGRLGNQLFQYAFISTAAKKLNTTFFIDQSIEKFYVPKYFEINHYKFYWLDQYIFNIKGYKNLFSFYAKNKFYRIITKTLLKKNLVLNNEEHPKVFLEAITNNCLYYGYFQSPLYFESYNQKILKEFAVKQQHLDTYQEKYKSILLGKTIIAIHIRKGDYQNLGNLNLGGNDLSLPSSFYHKIIEQYKDKKNTLFVFVSDDANFITDEFKHIENKLISNDSEIHDFLHLMLADVCVIANSTFSWWAAYLNQKENKVVHCPKYFLGFKLKKEFPNAIYPKEWLQYEIE